MNRIVVIGQALHGYQNGHHLLISSEKLTEKSNNKMDILSDLSGPEVFEGFNEYFTGYYLPDQDKVVLGYTWYANEMKRPGCVWTHSLLINRKDMMLLSKNINVVLRLFTRPSDIDDIDKYGKSVTLETTELVSNIRNDYNKTLYLIWALWGNQGPSLIAANSSNEFSYEIIYLWMRLYDNLDNNFSFSTGSLAVRRYETEILSLQIIPRQIIGQVSIDKQKYKILHQLHEINAFPKWAELAYNFLQKDGWKNFNKFRNKFGKKYSNNVFFTHLLKLYAGSKADKNQLSIYEGLLIIEQIFDNKKSIEMRNIFVNLYLEDEFDEWISNKEIVKVLQYLLGNNQVNISGDKLTYLIREGYEIELAETIKFVEEHLIKSHTDFGYEMLKIYAAIISVDNLPYMTGMNLMACKLFIELNPNLAKCQLLWKEGKEFQKEILHSVGIVVNKVEAPSELIKDILLISEENIISDLYDIFKSTCIGVFVDCLLENQLKNPSSKESIIEVCRQHYDICLAKFNRIYNNLNDYQLLDMLDMIYLCGGKTVLLKNEVWISIYNIFIENHYLNKMELKISILYFSVMMNSNTCLPAHIAAFVYNCLNQCLSTQQFPDEMWWAVERYLPDVLWVHQWDKCKRIRRALKGKGYKVKAIIDADKDDLDIHLL